MRGRRRAVLGLLLGLVGCTDRVVLYDLVLDAGPDVVAKDGGLEVGPPPIDGGCQYWPMYPRYLQQSPELLILLDRSAPMQAPLVPGGASRQSLVESALLQSISTFQAKVKFGFEQFPPDVTDSSYGSCQWDSCCAGDVWVQPVLWGYSAMRNPVQCGDPPGSLCAPASYESASSAALAEARDLFRYPSWSGDERYVLLATASDPTCSPGSDNRQPCDSAKKAASDLVNLQVGIFLLSLGGQPSSKSCLAGIGDYGTPYAPSSPNQVSSAVNEIVSTVARASCTLATTDPPIASATLSVYFGKSTVIPQNDKDGWSFDDASRFTITLAGSWCQNFLDSQATELHTSYSCSTCPGPDACSWVH